MLLLSLVSGHSFMRGLQKDVMVRHAQAIRNKNRTPPNALTHNKRQVHNTFRARVRCGSWTPSWLIRTGLLSARSKVPPARRCTVCAPQHSLWNLVPGHALAGVPTSCEPNCSRVGGSNAVTSAGDRADILCVLQDRLVLSYVSVPHCCAVTYVETAAARAG